MSIIKSEDQKKWINAFVALLSVLLAFIMIKFFNQMGEWFDLEAKIPYFHGVVQGFAVVLGVVGYFVIFTNKKIALYLDEVYGELVKVVWPEQDSVVKMTVGIVIALSIVSGILVLIDYTFRYILNLIY